MSGHQEHPPLPIEKGHDHHDAHVDHGSFKTYVTGFVLAVILTAIPFWLVLGKVFDKSSTTGLVLLGFAAVQIVVHMIYFLHMNTKSEEGWSMLALIFTVMLVVIMLSGSVWVMYHLNHNMMPGVMSDSAQETVPESFRQAVPSAPSMPNMPNMPKMHNMQTMP
ncbi:cytochrome o ubiquinol oxidase subunit IV [Glaciimonas immobilis]|uniref:Cytochrome bo(3) ubiquinol oxidase subunit 4 n=1 Tax=Glaciimonas immobilis TaxID=728004 RepID=A0A840RY72_9BURK|nr:cytochrome o ubiquinol oxidase subunit IV [Glaciimonas immobilis]KAF3996335.1 cytochrome o ubiquinol oxidase subunit IV [Glaciimonas immobilis]MBB5202172.1 cytochrome o ubiquinol oxidase operon protein cyoD [Glaciimonas immobilis]